MAKQTAKTLKIGAVAKQTGFSIDTIRYYERQGLLPEPERRASGYRQYDEDSLMRLRFIKRAKELGFKLEEIAELFELSNDNQQGVREAKQKAQQHIDAIALRINELEQIRDNLQALVECCPGHGKTELCPIFKALKERQEPFIE